MRWPLVVAITVMVIIDVLVLAWIYQRKGKAKDAAPVQITQQVYAHFPDRSGPRASREETTTVVRSQPAATPDTLVVAVPAPPPTQDQSSPAERALVPLVLRLPDKAFRGTPKDLVLSGYVEPLPTEPRPPLLVPPGLTNVALGKLPTSSDRNASPDTLLKVTDGDKGANDDAIIFLRKGTQWVQLDLGEPTEMYAIVLWHAHNSAKVYHDVIVQAADDPSFADGVRTLINNDQDNTSGLVAGTDREYFETHEGRLIVGNGVTARYLRFYSKGSTESALNEYTEIEVYGRGAAPEKPGS